MFPHPALKPFLVGGVVDGNGGVVLGGVVVSGR